MRVLMTRPEICKGVRACVTACSKYLFKEENPEKSAIRVDGNPGGPFTIQVCNQCGECIAVCPTQALYRDKAGVVKIDKDKCVGCLSCVGFCPHGAMYFHADYTEPFKCVACGSCVKACPNGVLYLENVNQ
ncbi:MAG: 4Fe-4S binding protein [Candidatus Eisenbacteria sp.]|nr:4Fe-4S binding protein [Candidatus Eisenbacteria bacterium]